VELLAGESVPRNVAAPDVVLMRIHPVLPLALATTV